MKYKDATSIGTRQHSVWLVRLPDGEKRIQIWHRDAAIENVHAHCKSCYPQFLLGQLGVGEYVIAKTVSSYADDGRFVNQDWEVRF